MRSLDFFFQLTQSIHPHYGPGVDSGSNRSEYQESSWGVKGGRRVRLTSLPSVSRLSVPHSVKTESRDNAVGIATGYGLDDQGVGVRVPMRAKIFTFPYRPDRLWSPLQWVLGALSPWIKRPRREADHSPPTSAEVRKTWVYTSTPPYVFIL
jgi:hypothetical protein